MPRRGASGTKGLIKRHHGCKPGPPTRCDCQWRGRYKGEEVRLAVWAKCRLDPHTKGEAVKVLNRFLTAVDNGTFDPAGERVLGAKQTLATFIDEWKSRYAEEHGLSMRGLGGQLNVIATGRLGDCTLEYLAGASQEIEEWLHVTGKARKWSAKTWNEYHGVLNRLFTRATKWQIGGKPRIAINPMAYIERRRKVAQPDHFKQRHLVEDVEDRLFVVVDQLNTARPSTRGKLTQEQADEIRAQLAAGTPGAEVAARFKVSAAVVSAIKLGDIWKAEKPIGTKGTEMRRRLIAAFDGGLRAGEMLLLQLHHVNWRPVSMPQADGSMTEAYEIALPPTITKGGKTTGEIEYVYAATDRFRHVLEARRFALKNNKPTRTFIFGSEDGRQQQGFVRMWKKLFTLAGLDWGRDKGLVWHTIRHEYISRVAENTKDPVLTQDVARHRSLETTQGYFHTRRDRRMAAAASLNRPGRM
jgi:integrase-like protein